MRRKIRIFLLEFSVLIVIGNFYSKLLFSFIWAIFHEIAHIIMARFFNIKLKDININLTGLSTYGYEVEELNYTERMIVYLIGPLFNIVMALILMGLYSLFEVPFIRMGIDINLTLALFNMLPAYPLDGARIYEILLSKKFLYKKSKDILINLSFVIGGILFLGFCISIYLHSANFSFFLTSIFIIYSTVIEKETRMYITIGNMFKKRRKIIKDNYIENKSISIYYKVNLVKVLKLIDKDRFNCFYVLDDDMKLISIIYEDMIIEGLKEYGNITIEELIEKKKVR